MSVENQFLALDKQIIGDIYTSTEVMDNLVILCDEFGSRFGGTAGEKQAADFIKAKFEDYGLKNVHLEPFEYLGWTRGVAKLEIISPIQKVIPCITLPQSPPVNIEATLIDIGDGAPVDFEERAEEIKGKFVLTNSVVSVKGTNRWLHRSEKYNHSVLAGATGFIFVNHYPGYGPVTGAIGNDGSEGIIPGLGLSYEDGHFLKRLIARHGEVKIRLTSTDKSSRMTSWNIVGEIPGQVMPDQVVLVGCHYDGHDISQGAGDPISGATPLIEAARVLAKHHTLPACTIRFALWGVEEIGLLGSRTYAKVHAAELDNLRFYLNTDSAGTRHQKDITLNVWPELEPLFKNWCKEMADEFDVGQSVHAYSDHYSFFTKGVPTGGIEQVKKSLAGRGYGHTMYDTVDKVNLRDLREAAALTARLLLRVANEADWPVQRRDEDTIDSVFDSGQYREAAALQRRIDQFYAQLEAQSTPT